jgi:hypothetical protein
MQRRIFPCCMFQSNDRCNESNTAWCKANVECGYITWILMLIVNSRIASDPSPNQPYVITSDPYATEIYMYENTYVMHNVLLFLHKLHSLVQQSSKIANKVNTGIHRSWSLSKIWSTNDQGMFMQRMIMNMTPLCTTKQWHFTHTLPRNNNTIYSASTDNRQGIDVKDQTWHMTSIVKQNWFLD